MDQEQKTREELMRQLEELRRRLRDQETASSGEKNNGRLPPEAWPLIQKLLERAEEMITIQDANGRYLYCTGAPKYGLASSDMVGKLPRDLFDAETADRIMARVKHVAATGRALKDEDTLVRQGKTMWFSQYLYPVTGDDDRVAAVGTILRDISDGVQAEEALRESEERFRQLFENAPDAVFIADAETGEIIAANAAASRLVGAPRERLIGLHYTGLHPPRLEQFVRSRFEKSIGQSDTRRFATPVETLVLKPDGSEVPVEIVAQTINLQGKKFLYGIFRDITRRVRMEQELRETERRYHNMLESVNLITVMLNTEGEVLFCNQFLLNLTGWKIEEVLRKSWFDLFVPDARIKDIFLRAMQTGEFPVHYENVIRTRSGEERTVSWSNTVLRDLNGGVIGTASIGEDITDRRKTEQALQESMQRFRDLVETTSDWIWEVNAHGRYTYASSKVRDLLGYEPEEMLGKSPMDFMPPDEAARVSAIFGKIVQDRAPIVNLLNTNRRRDGRLVALETNGIPIFDSAGTLTGYRGIDRDVTERKKMEEELLKAQKLESIGILAGGIAHDFNNLLMAIMGNIALAKMQLRSSDKACQLLSDAEGACDQARDLSYRLLTFSKGGEPFRQPVVLPAVLRDAAALSLGGSGVVPAFDLAEGLFTVEADAGQIKQVLYNLLTNAKESMPGGGTVAISARNVILDGQDQVPLPPGPYAEIIVEDRGAGIPREDLKRIFDPYFSTKEMGNQRGRGLGLAICHSIVQKHDGHIAVESAVGKGTTVHVYLPAQEQGTRKEAKTSPDGPGRLPLR